MALLPLRALGMVQVAGFTDPHGGYTGTTDTCLECHAVHDPAGTTLLAQPTEKETCYQCHDGSGALSNVRAEFGEATIGSSTQTSFHPVPNASHGYSLSCGDCHTPHKLKTDFINLLRLNDGAGGWIYSPVGSPIGNVYCYRCHGNASSFPDPLGDHTDFEGGVHQLLSGVPEAGSGIQCVNCHNSHGSAYPGLSEQEATCFTCHNAATPNTNPDLPFDTTEIEYAFTAATNDYDATDTDGLIRIYHHPIGDAEQDGGNRQVECASCHNAHLADQDYSPTTSKLANPADTRLDWQVQWIDGTLRGNISEFCVLCHQGPGVAAPIDAGIWVPYDIRLTDDTAVTNGGGAPHDNFDPVEYFTDTRSAHGEGGSLVCTVCHDPHGSSNAFMLREYVISAGGHGVPEGQTSGQIAGFDDTDTAEQRAILSSFCDGCHAPGTHHTPKQPCTRCHYHGSGRF